MVPEAALNGLRHADHGIIGRSPATTVIRASGLGRELARKPDEAFAAAEKLMPDARRLELFSRQRRPDWSNWGNETQKFGAQP